MAQAAHSGKHNIVERNQVAVTSSEIEIKLTKVAKTSLEKLLNDYEDYLHERNLTSMGRVAPRYNAMRQYKRSEDFRKDYTDVIQRLNDEGLANLPITLSIKPTTGSSSVRSIIAL